MIIDGVLFRDRLLGLFYDRDKAEWLDDMKRQKRADTLITHELYKEWML